MKHIIYFLLLFSCVTRAGNGTELSQFDAANELYKKEKYREAIQAYETILSTKKHSADVYFNLANAYYKTHQIAPAIYNYEKALLLAPNNKDIKTNLEFAKKMTIDDIKPTNKVGFAKSIDTLTSSFHYDTWAKILIGLSVLFLVFFIGYYFSQKSIYKRLFFVGMFIVPFLIAIGFAAAFSEKTLYNNEKPAIIFAESTTLKSEPRENAADVAQLHEGTKVMVLESIDQWKKVQLANETEGWIAKESIKEIK